MDVCCPCWSHWYHIHLIGNVKCWLKKASTAYVTFFDSLNIATGKEMLIL